MTFRGGIDSMNTSNSKLEPNGVFGMSRFSKIALIFVALIAIIFSAIVITQINKPSTWQEALEQYAGTPEYKSVDPERPLRSQTSTFEIAGRTFEMPSVYIQTNLGGKRVQDGINLLYVLPNYTHRAQFKSKEEYNAAFKARRFAHMLLMPEASRFSLPNATKNPLNDIVRNRRRSLPKEEYKGTHNGLDFYRWYKRSFDNLVLQDEIYINKNSDGVVIDFIECRTHEAGAKVPGCSHRFIDKNLIYEIYYNKDNYFSQWQEQRNSAIKFIDSFEIKSTP